MAQMALKAKPKVTAIKTGLQKKGTEDVAQKLSEALADSFILYLKTQGVHWNIVGPTFYSLHKLTEAQYEDLLSAVDQLAERIRALGHTAPASFDEYSKLSKLISKPTLATAEHMLQTLIDDNQSISRRLRHAYKTAEDADDVVTADIVTHRIAQHELNIWMLQAVTG